MFPPHLHGCAPKTCSSVSVDDLLAYSCFMVTKSDFENIAFNSIKIIWFNSLEVIFWLFLVCIFRKERWIPRRIRKNIIPFLNAIQRACWIIAVILEPVKTPLAIRRCWRDRKGVMDLKGSFPSGDSPNDQPKRRPRREKAQVILWE